jgi:molecular chaperone DnaK (HSP70)
VNDGSRPVVGFDFGTSTSLIARRDGIVPIGQLGTWLPSMVGFDEKLVVGEDTDDMPDEQVVRSIKRCITDERYKVRVETADGLRDLVADDAMAELLREVARRATARGVDLGNLRLGCPAMWDRRQRRRLLEIGDRAGLSVDFASLVDEPVAAGIAWLAQRGQGGRSTEPIRVVVFDMGGGTLDLAVLDVRGLSHQDVSVLAALGTTDAGDLLDERIAEDMERMLAADGVAIDNFDRADPARKNLLDEARLAKEALSTGMEYRTALQPRYFGVRELRYTRQRLETLFTPMLDRAEQYIAAALRAAQLTEAWAGSAHDLLTTPLDQLREGVDYVLLSGGMSRIPLVSQRLSMLFPRAAVESATNPPEEAVARGLAAAPQYGRINMFRPAFDVSVEWDDDQRSIYEAFTPLYQSWQVVQGGTNIRYKRNGLDLDLPRTGKGRMRVISHSGERARVSVGGRDLDGFPVMLDDQKFEFVIFCNGRVRLTDANGTFDGQIDDWYTMQSGQRV